ncbi:MAG: hypothetical protein LAT79_15875 [Kiritimatiellae bacterium]|nr:hypothetical protein [Kiritimatiellia bacterium]
MPRAKRLRPDILHALAVAAVAGLSHLVWAVMPLPALPPPPPPPAVTFTALTEARPLLASPILFSLPSSLGFSSIALQQRNRILPPLNSPLDLSLHTRLPLEDTYPDSAAGLPALPPPPIPLQHPLPLPEPDRPARNRWHLRALDDRPDLPPLHMFRPPQIPDARHPRHITGTLQFNEFGQVETLLIDPARTRPAPDILQSLRHVRIPHQAAPLRVPFELHFQPAEARP